MLNIRMNRCVPGLAGAACVTALLVAAAAHAQGSPDPAPMPVSGPETTAAPAKISVVPIRDNVYVLMNGGANVTVQTGREGVLLVDAGKEGASDALLAAIRTLSSKPIRYIIDTHLDVEHTGGTAALAKSGESVGGGTYSGAGITDAEAGAAVLAHEQVLTKVSTLPNPPPFEGWPTSTYFTDSKRIFFNDEGIEILHPGKAHSSGDSIVFLRKSDVICAGDIYTPTQYPVIDPADGGSLQGTIDALNRILEMAIPSKMQEGGTLVVPGHGRVGDISDVVEYRDMLTIVRNYIREMIREGKSLEQVQQARPTFGYDPLYGSDTGPWTTKMFVEAVYRELRSNKGRGS